MFLRQSLLDLDVKMGLTNALFLMLVVDMQNFTLLAVGYKQAGMQ